MRSIAALLLGALVLAAVPVRAEEPVRVLSSVAVKAVMDALVPEFQKTTKHKVSAEFGIAAAMKTRMEGGEPYDVAILTPAMLDDLVTKKLIDPASRPVVARSGLGLMVKKGAPKPDVRSVDSFKKTLLAAKSITYVPASASGALLLATLDKLGIADAVKAKAKTAATGDEVNANIASGAADLAVLPVSEILPVAGAELGGVFPAEIQSYIVMAAGINPRSANAAAAREFVAFITSAKATPVVKSKGMER